MSAITPGKRGGPRPPCGKENKPPCSRKSKNPPCGSGAGTGAGAGAETGAGAGCCRGAGARCMNYFCKDCKKCMIVCNFREDSPHLNHLQRITRIIRNFLQKHPVTELQNRCAICAEKFSTPDTPGTSHRDVINGHVLPNRPADKTAQRGYIHICNILRVHRRCDVKHANNVMPINESLQEKYLLWISGFVGYAPRYYVPKNIKAKVEKMCKIILHHFSPKSSS